MASKTIVLYPSPGIGHLVAMVELAKLILKHHPCFSITILIAIPPYNTGSTIPYINKVSKSTPSLTFYYLPTVPFSTTTNSSYHETLIYEFVRLNDPHVHQALQTISASSPIPAFILDMFCSSSIEFGHQLNIPVYYFFTSCASVLSVYLYFPTLVKKTTNSLKEMTNKLVLDFPGVPLIPCSDMFKPLLDPDSKIYEESMFFAAHMAKSRGIIVNSFDSLEPRALKALTDGLCVPEAPTPPIFCIGPLIASDDRSAGEADGGQGQISCLEWLDKQPSRSVVYLCFGSMGLFSEAQLKEIAKGLEKSGKRFLWVVRSPPVTDQTTNGILATPEPDLDVLLPDGFVDRTKEMGMVVKSWAPQVEVLKKEAVGGFVTHCGWNSVLESVCGGVPMVAWPLYAEQRTNKVVLVEELKVALPIEEGEGGFVKAEEVEKIVRDLMESEKGNMIRQRVGKQSGEAQAAMTEYGSSVSNLNNLAELWLRKRGDNHDSEKSSVSVIDV